MHACRYLRPASSAYFGIPAKLSSSLVPKRVRISSVKVLYTVGWLRIWYKVKAKAVEVESLPATLEETISDRALEIVDYRELTWPKRLLCSDRRCPICCQSWDLSLVAVFRRGRSDHWISPAELRDGCERADATSAQHPIRVPILSCTYLFEPFASFLEILDPGKGKEAGLGKAENPRKIPKNRGELEMLVDQRDMLFLHATFKHAKSLTEGLTP